MYKLLFSFKKGFCSFHIVDLKLFILDLQVWT
jgi:hypothetical protein